MNCTKDVTINALFKTTIFRIFVCDNKKREKHAHTKMLKFEIGLEHEIKRTLKQNHVKRR